MQTPSKTQPVTVPSRVSFGLILAELQQVFAAASLDQVEVASKMLLEAKRIFFVGAGRSALALKMAAMRFMHLGLQVYVVGEVTAPAISVGDLLVAASASGTTKTVHLAAEVAKKVHAKVLVITTSPKSALSQQADGIIILPAASKAQMAGRASEQYAGSLFEQAVLLLFDGIFHSLWKDGAQSTEQLLARHANLE